jgi:hypothetical protein
MALASTFDEPARHRAAHVFSTPNGANMTSIDDAGQLLQQPGQMAALELRALAQGHPNTSVRTVGGAGIAQP